MKPRNEVRNILLVVNSSSNDFGKYPIGNKDLTNKLKMLEILKEIKFNCVTNRWEKSNEK